MRANYGLAAQAAAKLDLTWLKEFGSSWNLVLNFFYGFETA